MRFITRPCCDQSERDSGCCDLLRDDVRSKTFLFAFTFLLFVSILREFSTNKKRVLRALSLFSLSASPFRVVPLPVAFFLSISVSRCFYGTLFFFVVARSRKRENEREITRERERGFDFESFPGEDLSDNNNTCARWMRERERENERERERVTFLTERERSRERRKRERERERLVSFTLDAADFLPIFFPDAEGGKKGKKKCLGFRV